MPTNFGKQAGAALIISTALLILTMVLHPTGGSMSRLIERSSFIIGTHVLALLAIPVCFFGFWGLTTYLQGNGLLSRLAMSVMAFGLFAALCAAAINGLALPLFVQRFQHASPQTVAFVKTIISYNIALNQAFDFIFIGATCIAMSLWSIAIVRKRALPAWIGVYGLLVGSTLLLLLVSGFVLVDLHGFRFFIFAVVTWFLLTGIYLRKRSAAAA